MHIDMLNLMFIIRYLVNVPRYNAYLAERQGTKYRAAGQEYSGRVPNTEWQGTKYRVAGAVALAARS